MDTIDRIPEIALSWHQAGRGAVLATVVETWGSAPRRVGAQLAVSLDGEMAGSVSGGCVEGAVVLEAQEALAEGRQRILEYGITDNDAFSVGLACGGRIRILVEPVGAVLPEDMLSALVQQRAARTPVAYVVNTQSGARTLEADGHVARFRSDRSGFAEDGQTFVAIHNPPLRLIVVGAVHIAQALVPMARMAGYDPVIVDPRESFGSEARFPAERILNEWTDDAIEAVGLDGRTALVLLTHDPKLDDPGLHLALNSTCFYIGALGSNKTHAKRIARLQEAGFGADQIARIHGPVGLDIGSATPAEIAISILAEMTQVLRK